IETDERWSSKGGPDRGPEDAEEMPSKPDSDLNLFNREEDEGPVDVPDVTGSSQGMAEMRLARAGLEVGTVEQRYHDEVPIGRLIEQDPDPGTTVENGYKVDIIISRGPE
ncbi:MAG: PASTA domain-containing protein, partial [Bacillota bacterium]